MRNLNKERSPSTSRFDTFCGNHLPQIVSDYIVFVLLFKSFVIIIHRKCEAEGIFFLKPLTNRLALDIIIKLLRFATVAQLVEQRIRNAQVVRSSRTSSSRKDPGSMCVSWVFFLLCSSGWVLCLSAFLLHGGLPEHGVESVGQCLVYRFQSVKIAVRALKYALKISRASVACVLFCSRFTGRFFGF